MRALLLLFLLPCLLHAHQKVHILHEDVEVLYEPWFTGPFLAPSANTPDLGKPAIEPSITFFATYGNYNDSWGIDRIDTIWAVNPLVDFQFALTKRFGVEIIASSISSFRGSQHSSHLQDTLVLLGYQLALDQKDSWVPDLKIYAELTFPTGKHDDLDSDKDGIDSTGQGAFFFGPTVAFQKLFYLEHHFFVLHGSAGYFFPTRAKMKGRNVYGGEEGTKGTIHPGEIFTAFISGEYSFSQRWAIACDLMFLHQKKASDFKGTLGFTPTGAPAIVGLPESTQISITPGFEYSFAANSGLVAGSWLTLAGRNKDAFVSFYFAYLHVF